MEQSKTEKYHDETTCSMLYIRTSHFLCLIFVSLIVFWLLGFSLDWLCSTAGATINFVEDFICFI
jgi:hypothetical protein